MTVRKKKDNFFLPHVWAFIVLRVRWITYIPRNIYYRINRLGWKLVFWLMLNASKNLEKKLKPIEKYFVFRNWCWNQVMRWMTAHEGWVMTVTRPRAKHMKDKWATIAFHNPKYLNVAYETADDGEAEIQSVGLLPLDEHLITNWYLTPEQVERVKGADRVLVSDFLEELENDD